ncbi:hypothetical protein [Scytonema sp. PRP1]
MWLEENFMYFWYKDGTTFFVILNQLCPDIFPEPTATSIPAIHQKF